MSPRRTRRGTVRESVIEIDTSLKSASKTTRSTRRANKSQVIKTEEDSDGVVETTASSFLSNTSSNVRGRKRRGQESLLGQDSLVSVSADESQNKSQKKKNPSKSQKTRGAKPKNLDSSLISEDESFDAKAKKSGKRVSYSNDLISEDEEVPTAALKKRGRLNNQASSKVAPRTPEKSTPQKASSQIVGSPSGRVTPKSSPIFDIPLTPHRSTKTPRKSPVNLGSPKTHSRNSDLLNVSRKLSILDSPPSSGASTPLQHSDTSGSLKKSTRSRKTSKSSVAKSNSVPSDKKGIVSPRRKVSISPKVVLKPMKSKQRLSTKKSPIKISAVSRKNSASSPVLKSEKLRKGSTSKSESLEILTNIPPSPSKSSSSKSNEVSQTNSRKPQNPSPTKSKKSLENVSLSKSDNSSKKSPAARVIKSSKNNLKTVTAKEDVLRLSSSYDSLESSQKSKRASPSKGSKASKNKATPRVSSRGAESPQKTSPGTSSKSSGRSSVSGKTKNTSKSTASPNKSAVGESQNIVLPTFKTEILPKTSSSQSKKSPKHPSLNKSSESSKVPSPSKSKKSLKKTVIMKSKKTSKITFPLMSKKMPKIVLALKPKKPLKLSRTLSPKKSTKQVSKTSKSLSPHKPEKSPLKVDSLMKASKASPKKTLSKSHSPKKSMSPRVMVNKLSSPRMNKANVSAKQNQPSIKLIPVDHSVQKVKSPRSPKSLKKSPIKPATPSAKILSSMTKNAKRLSSNPAISTPSNVLSKKFQTLKPKNTSTPREKTKKSISLSSKTSPPKQSLSAKVAWGSQNSKSAKSKIIKSLDKSAKIKVEPQLLEDESEPSMDSSSLIHMSDVFDSDLSTKNDTLKIGKGKRPSPSKAKLVNASSLQKSSAHNTPDTQRSSLRTSIKERSMNETYDIANLKSPESPRRSNKRIANEAKVASEREAKKNCKVHFANSSIGSQNQPSRISRVGTPGHAMQRKKLPVSESRKNDSNQSFNNKSASRRSVSLSSARTPIASANLRRSMSMSDSVSKPRRSTYEAQVASVNRLSRPRAIFTSEKKSLEKKETATRTPSASSAKKIPNFAEIHQKNFAKMESLVDLKKRVEKRHVTLSAKKSGVLPSDTNNGYNRFGFKLRKNDAINIISKKSGGSVDSREAKRDQARTALKGVRMNRRFELQMKARLKTS